MNYTNIVIESFQIVWKEKKLWVISALGTAFFALGNAIYTTGYLNWYQSMLTKILTTMTSQSQEAMPELSRMMPDYVGAIMTVWGMIFIVGYVVNLVARAGGIAEADRAWQGEHVAVMRGLFTGVRKAPGMFLIDLIWALPGLVMGLVSMVLSFAILYSLFTSMMQMEGQEAGGHIGGLIGVFFLLIIAIMGLGLVYIIIRAIFAPLMFQSLVAGERSIGEAIREGWRLSRKNLKAMVIFWLLLFAIRLGMGMVIQLVVAPFFFMFITPMFRAMQAPDTLASAINWPLLFLFGALMALVSWGTSSLLQSVTLALYARVYREFVARETMALSLEA